MLKDLYAQRTKEDAIATAKALQVQGYKSILHPLDGDYLSCVDTMHEAGISGALAIRYPYTDLERICEKASNVGLPLEFDMRHEETIDATLQAYETARQYRVDATLCVQAYLPRTLDDLARIRPDKVRVVKGAFYAKNAYTDDRVIHENFLKIATWCEEQEVHTKIATHDKKLINECRELFGTTAVEFQFLYGKHERVDLLAKGHKVAAYVMYGELT
jgi:proline dehydrogenase